MKRLGFVFGFALSSAFLAACSSDTTVSNTASGGDAAVGGTTSSGGCANSGAPATGGSATIGGAGGGASGSGGASAGGNHPATGGSASGGVNPGSGGSSGGGVGGAPKCGTGSPILAGTQDTGFAKCDDAMTVHRPRIVVCPDLRVEATPGSCSATAACQSNADCTSVMHGVCRAGFCMCFPGCTTDADCGAGKICQCDSTNGTCVEARCKSDADCGSGLVCALSLSQSFFACQTPNDACLSPLDCGACVTSCAVQTDGHRACQRAAGCDPGTGGGGP